MANLRNTSCKSLRQYTENVLKQSANWVNDKGDELFTRSEPLSTRDESQLRAQELLAASDVLKEMTGDKKWKTL